MSESSLKFTRNGKHSVNKLMILAAMAFALLLLDQRHSVVQKAKNYAATAIYPLQWLANQPVEWFEYVSTFMQSQSYLLSENARLTTENTRLKMEARQTEAQWRELDELKNLLSLHSNGVPASTAAQVISHGKDSMSARVIIDKGSDDGLLTGDAVLDEGGLIGQLGQVHPFSTEVRLIVDSQMVIPVMVARTGVRSLIYGDGRNIALRYFPSDADLRAGDVLLTSGMDSVYPAGIPVAKVAHAQKQNHSPYYRVELAPSARLRSSKYVLIVPQNTHIATESTVSE